MDVFHLGNEEPPSLHICGVELSVKKKLCCHLLILQANHLQHPQLQSSEEETKNKCKKRTKQNTDGITTIPVNDIFFSFSLWTSSIRLLPCISVV
jgi:hypothetical protein